MKLSNVMFVQNTLLLPDRQANDPNVPTTETISFYSNTCLTTQQDFGDFGSRVLSTSTTDQRSATTNTTTTLSTDSYVARNMLCYAFCENCTFFLVISSFTYLSAPRFHKTLTLSCELKIDSKSSKSSWISIKCKQAYILYPS